MKNRTFKQLVMRSVSGIFIVLFASLGLVACGGGSSGGNASQGGDIPVSVKVDTKLTDALQVKTIEAVDIGGAPRPLAVMRDDDGVDAQFVENELVITTDNPDTLNAFIKRWDGQLLKTIDLKAAGITGMGNLYLVRINTSLADASRLEVDLKTLQPEVGGDVTVSSEVALGLIAASARENSDGLSVAVNWVGSGANVASGNTTDETSNTDSRGVSFGANAFDWNFMNAGSTQDIGVTEAWKLLDRQGKLNKWIKLAILDMGFAPAVNGDIDPAYLAMSNVPGRLPIGTSNLLWCTGGASCPWHGTGVANAAMGLLDNMKGAAGPAGAVAKPVLVYTFYDFFTAMNAVIMAKVAGAKIINMSFGVPVPAIVSFTVLPFNLATRLTRASGTLLFAAAGNDNKNVDKKRCVLGICWEKKWFTPCENAGVICVGGLQYNSKNRAGNSNYGRKNVDIFGPYTVVVGSDYSSRKPPGSAYVTSGTSISSPFVAGIAALIWSANHSLSADQVADIMMRTAHTSPDDSVERYVNAQAAVKEALGTSIHITEPLTGVSITRGRPVIFAAAANSTEHNNPVISWSSDVQGSLGTGSTITLSTLTLGTHVVTATVTYDDGFSKIDRVTVSIVNLVPVVTIDQPPNYSSISRSTNIILHGSSFDGDASPDFKLLDSQVHWTLNGIDVGTGHSPAPFSAASIGLPAGGPYEIRFEGTDGVATVFDTVNVYIGSDPDNLPPNVNLTSPVAGSSVLADKQRADGTWYRTFVLTWSAIDPEDGVVPFSRLAWLDSRDGVVPYQSLTVITNTFTLPGPGSVPITTTTYSVELEVTPGAPATTHRIMLVAVDSNGSINSVVNTVIVNVLN